MAEHTGSLVAAAAASAPPTLAPSGLVAATSERVIMDVFEADAAQNDTIVLASNLDWDRVLDPRSVVYFDDMGTSITLDIGFRNDEDILAAAVDVATAAGSCLLMASVDIANYYKPLWGLAGYTSKAAAIAAGYETATIVAKLEGGNPAAGTIVWDIRAFR